MSTITVVISSRDRPNLLEEMITSVLNQTIIPDKFIVSDDSVCSVEEIKKLEKKFSNVNFIYRGGIYSNTEHIYILFKECDTDLLTICGDDDILHKKYIEEILIAKNKFKEFAAYGVNGKTITDEGKISKNLMWKGFKDYLIIDPLTLIKRWIDIDLGGVPAVLGYTFNMDICRQQIDSNKPDILKGGNFWDTFFFYNFCKISNLLWINKSLIYYRIHENSLSNKSLLTYKIFISYLKNNTNLFSKLEKKINKYRYLHLLVALRDKKKMNYKFIIFKLSIFLFLNSHYFRKKLFFHFFNFFLK